jgi:hypothetical protein
MRKTAFSLAALTALVFASPAPAWRVLMVPYAFRVATDDAIVVGKVTEVADKAEKAELYKGDDREMKFATIKVQSAVLGKIGTTMKVGFLAPPRSRPGRPPARQFTTVSLSKGQEACLFLTNHPTRKGVYYVASGRDLLGKEYSPDWKKMLPEIKKYAGLLATPMKALQSKDADERLLAAALLIERYKTPTDSRKTEPAPAREVKLLLNVLAEADWNRGYVRNYKMSPRGLFVTLGATAKDGWVAPKEYSEFVPAAKKWLKENAGKFKMTRYVRPKVSVEISEEPGK